MIIYKSTNKVNGKIYIGQTTNSLETRIKNHIKESKKDNVRRPFLKAIKKYGVENFLFEIVDHADNLDELNEKEINCISEYNSIAPNGYNITGGGQGKKLKTTKEFKKTISEGLKNSEKWQKILNSDEYKNKIKNNFIGFNKGKKFTKEHKDKIWEGNKERILKYNKSTSKKWIIVDINNNIERITGKEEYFKNLGMDSGNMSRMANKLNKNKVIKRYNGYYCFINNGESDETILNNVIELDNIYKTEFNIYNKITRETKIIKKDEIYSFCVRESYDYSSFLRMVKGNFKSYKNWCLK